MTDIKENILIADDDPTIVKILKDRLDNKGFKVITASNGEEALTLRQKENLPQ